MSYITENPTFILADYIDYIVNRLPEEQQTDEIHGIVETNVTSIVIQTIRNFMSFEDLESLIEKMNNNDDQANSILSEYINNYPELRQQLEAELDHFENLASNYF